MKRLSLLALPILVLALAACGSSSKSTTTASSAPSSTPGTTSPAATSQGAIHATMKDLAFHPDTIHAKVGQTVTWTNDDTPPHNVTWVSGPKFASSPTMNPGATFSLKLTQAGVIHYYCTIHPFMKATIVVSQ